MLQDADLVVANGLGLEEGLEDVLASAAADGANVIELAPRLDPIPFATGRDSGGASTDPHVWMDPVRMADAARLVADELEAIDESADWPARAAVYAEELAEAHREIEATLGAIPAERRKLVTNHDSLGYFAGRYGFEVVGVVIPGGTTLAQPSSSELARLVADIERTGTPAIFAETTDSSSLAEAVAAEISRPVAVVELHTGSLGEPGSGAETLIGMLKLDAARIAAALA
jgi:zinc/manganese transport system substrate-binding protein